MTKRQWKIAGLIFLAAMLLGWLAGCVIVNKRVDVLVINPIVHAELEIE